MQLKSCLLAPEKWLYATGRLSTARLRLPDFLCIGAQKAGTTWLHANLRCHPELFLPPTKEAHYFDRKFHRPLAYYARRFRPAGERRAGEITPAYSLLPVERIRFIRQVMPGVRLIYLLRNPIDRAWSQAQMEVVRPRLELGLPIGQDAIIRSLRSERNRSRGAYLENIDRWLSVFPPEHLFVGFFDDLVERPELLLTGILRHVGADQPSDWCGFPLREVVKAGAGVPLPDELRPLLRDLYSDQIHALAERLGGAAARWEC